MKAFAKSFLLGTVMTMLTSTAFAGTTGKIAGVVRDNQGKPLPGANVIIAGTRMGGSADAEGAYFIINLDPGIYELTASLVGFNKQSQTGVSVKVDFTTPVDFELQETSLELGEIRVVAKRPPVEKDRTGSKYTVAAGTIDRLSTGARTSELLALQAGVSLDNNEPGIRGSDKGFRLARTVK